MTAGLVTNYSAVTELTNVTNSNTTKKATDDFQNALMNSTNKHDEQADNSAKTVGNNESKNIKGEEANKIDSDATGKNAKKNIAVTEKATDVEEFDETVVEEAAIAMMQCIAEILGVDVTDVQNAMSEMDIDAMSLLDGSGATDIVVALTEAEDAMDIMTNEDLFEALKEIKGEADKKLGELSDKMGITEEDAKDLVTDIKERGAELKIETQPSDKNDTGADNSSLNDAQNMTQNIMDNIKEAVANKENDNISSYATSMEDIYEQVSESIKLNMKADITEMEISLHPASLGNVKIQVAAKDGVITANFTAQNDEVKAAIESQLVELKERMNEQGMKVAAVEVTVESHAFDENLSKEGERAGQEPEKKKRRSINLNDLEDSDDISVEDDIRIAREMMMHNGTTVDYLT